jgi:chromosome segregation ATPase
MAWLRQRGPTDNSGTIDEPEKVLQFPPAPSTEDRGKAALELVHRAADVIRGVEERAAAVEAHARSLAEDAVEKLRLANDRIQSLEAERRAAEARAQEAEDALKRAASRIAIVEDQLSRAERLTRTAETRANETEKALIRVEDAVRTLLGQKRAVPRNQAAAA